MRPTRRILRGGEVIVCVLRGSAHNATGMMYKGRGLREEEKNLKYGKVGFFSRDRKKASWEGRNNCPMERVPLPHPFSSHLSKLILF
jgi:hypothetical protein